MLHGRVRESKVKQEVCEVPTRIETHKQKKTDVTGLYSGLEVYRLWTHKGDSAKGLRGQISS